MPIDIGYGRNNTTYYSVPKQKTKAEYARLAAAALQKKKAATAKADYSAAYTNSRAKAILAADIAQAKRDKLANDKAEAAAALKKKKAAAAAAVAGHGSSSGSGSGSGGSSGGSSGSSGGSSGTSAKTSTAKPTTSSWGAAIGAGPDIYAPLQSQIGQLQAQYAALKSQYSPTEFAYADAAGRDTFAADANARAESQLQAQLAAFAGQGTAAGNAYELARQQNAVAQAAQMQGINSGESQDIGRMQAMAANMGLASGQGALANNYGVMNDYSAQRAAAYSQGTLANSEASLAMANQQAAIAGQVAGVRAGAVGVAGDLQDKMYQQYADQFNQDRGQAFTGWNANQQNQQAADSARLEAAFTALQGQSSMLQNSMTMAQDKRDFANSNAWLNKNFDYTNYRDTQTFAEGVRTNNQNYGLTAAQIAQATADSKTNAGLTTAAQSAANQQYIMTLWQQAMQVPGAVMMDYPAWKARYAPGY